MTEPSFALDPLDELRDAAAERHIRDRAVLNNAWAGGHGGAGWEAIEIGF